MSVYEYSNCRRFAVCLCRNTQTVGVLLYVCARILKLQAFYCMSVYEYSNCRRSTVCLCTNTQTAGVLLYVCVRIFKLQALYCMYVYEYSNCRRSTLCPCTNNQTAGVLLYVCSRILKLQIFLQTRRRQPTARVPSVARRTILNGTLSELKYSNYDLIKN